MKSNLFRRIAAATCLLCLVFVTGLLAEEIEVTLDESLVYYGDPLYFSSPAVLNIETVFQEIAEYRRILEEDINTQDPEYWYLLDQANKKFIERVEIVAGENAYDLVCGTIEYTDGREVPDITELVVKELD